MCLGSHILHIPLKLKTRLFVLASVQQLQKMQLFCTSSADQILFSVPYVWLKSLYILTSAVLRQQPLIFHCNCIDLAKGSLIKDEPVILHLGADLGTTV